MTDFDELVRKSKEFLARLTAEEREEHFRKQRENWARAEASWPNPKFKFVNGVKVYESYEDYVND